MKRYASQLRRILYSKATGAYFWFYMKILCYLLAEGSLHIRFCLKIRVLGILALRLGAAGLLQVCKGSSLCLIRINSQQAQQGPGHF